MFQVSAFWVWFLPALLQVALDKNKPENSFIQVTLKINSKQVSALPVSSYHISPSGQASCCIRQRPKPAFF